MAAPQKRSRNRALVKPTVQGRTKGRDILGGVPKGTPGRAQGRVKRRGAWPSRRTFVVLVVVPVLLMLGSVYVHTVASGLKGEAARLEEERARAESDGERLEVKVTELSEPGRIRALARKNLRMQDPSTKDLETYGSGGEDVASAEGAKNKKNGE